MEPRHPSFALVLVAVIAAGTAIAGAEAPPMSPIATLPGDQSLGPAAGDQTAPAISRGDGLSLVVWVDAAAAANSISGGQSELDLVALRLDADGVPIEQTPFVVSRAAGYQRDPMVAWNGTDWLVVWEDQTPTEFYFQTEIHAVRVSAAGVVLDAEPIRPLGADGADVATLTSNGDDWLLVTQNYSAGQGGIRARRIAADGTLPDPAPVTLVEPTYFLYFGIDVDAAGGEYLLSYQASSTFKARRFAADLAPIGTVFDLPPVRALASNGTGYYLVYTGGPFNNLVLGSPMALDGTLLVPGGVDFGASSWTDVDVAFDGGRWWVGHKTGGQGIAFQRVSAGGALLDVVPFAIDPAHASTQNGFRLAARPAGGVTAVWQDHRAGGAAPYDVYAANVAGPADLEPGAAISLAAPMQVGAHLEAGPDQYLLTWTTRRSGSSRVLALRLDPDGVALDAEPIVVADGPAAAAPASAWNGSLYLVAWNDGGTVMTRRLLADGTWADPAPVAVMTGASPDVAPLGDAFLVATTDINNFPHYRATYVRRLDATTGQPIDADRFIVSYGNFAQFAKVVTFDGRWLVAWQDNFSHDDPQSAVYARFVDADASISEQITAIYATGGTPDLAVTGDTALFIWRNNSLSNANNYIAARRMSPDATFVDASPFVVAEAPGRQLNPVAAWDGTQFAATWEDQRDQDAFFDLRTDVFGARLAASGAPVLDPDGFPVLEAAAPQIAPAIASFGDGRCLTAASTLEDAPGLGTYRLCVRTADTAAVAPAADVNGDGTVDVSDLVEVILAWGACGDPCPADIDGDGIVGVADLVAVILAWSGPGS